VLPVRHGHGVGSALMHAVVAAGDALDYPAVVLLGAEAYYVRFGFLPARTLGITAPDASWGDHFQARVLHRWFPSLAGPYRYAAPFDDL
jgi:putative acetyltransferase